MNHLIKLANLNIIKMDIKKNMMKYYNKKIAGVSQQLINMMKYNIKKTNLMVILLKNQFYQN